MHIWFHIHGTDFASQPARWDEAGCAQLKASRPNLQHASDFEPCSILSRKRGWAGL
jgi:hypothetical protein